MIKKFSVITATYNNNDTFLECIDSLYAQSELDFEHIIIDSNSDNYISDCIKSGNYSNSSRFYQEPQGIYSALNFGISKARGEIIFILHSDDILNDKFILKEIYKIMKNKDLLIIFGDIVFFDKRKKKIVRYWRSQNYKLNLLKFGLVPPHTSLFISNKIYKKLTYNEKFTIAADFDFTLKAFNLADKNQIGYYDDTIVRMSIGGISTNLKYFILKFYQDYIILKNYSNYPLFLNLLKRFIKIKQFINLS
jgi:glycosyltransferase involved in cell wall biosynthesis